jgi:hypothetical protein
MPKVSWHDPFGHLKHKLWLKKRPVVKLAIWLPTTKSHELTWFPCLQVACNIPLKSSQRGLQLWFIPHFNQRFAHEVMGLQSWRSPNFGNFGTPFGSPKTKCHLDVGLVESYKIYHKGEGGGFPQVRAVMSLVSLSLPVVCPSTKSVPAMH